MVGYVEKRFYVLTLFCPCSNVRHLLEDLCVILDTPSKRTLWFFIIPLLSPPHQRYCQQQLGLPQHVIKNSKWRSTGHTLQWRVMGVKASKWLATRQCHCLYENLFMLAPKELSKLCISGPLWGELAVTSGFPSQRTSHAENGAMIWLISNRELHFYGKRINWHTSHPRCKYLGCVLLDKCLSMLACCDTRY